MINHSCAHSSPPYGPCDSRERIVQAHVPQHKHIHALSCTLCAERARGYWSLVEEAEEEV